MIEKQKKCIKTFFKNFHSILLIFSLNIVEYLFFACRIVAVTQTPERVSSSYNYIREKKNTINHS